MIKVLIYQMYNILLSKKKAIMNCKLIHIRHHYPGDVFGGQRWLCV